MGENIGSVLYKHDIDGMWSRIEQTPTEIKTSIGRTPVGDIVGDLILVIDFTKPKTISVDLPERYIINDGATILFWKNGDKTIVKRAKDDEFNPRLAFLTAFFQRYSGMSKNKANKYLASLQVEEPKENKTKKEKK